MIFKAWSIRSSWLLAVLLFMSGLVHADTLVTVTVDTSQLVGHPAGPFYLAFQLTDGSGVGNNSTMAVLSNFQFSGGSPSGSPALTGGASGDIGSSVSLTDSTFLNFFSQQFTPGNALTFSLSLTGNVEAGSTPDHFAFSILDQTLKPIPTKGGLFFDVFLAIDLDSTNPALQTFASDPQRLPLAGGNAIATGDPQVITVDAFPPTSAVTLSPLPNANGWNNSDVAVNFSASDNPGGSGVRQLNISAIGAQPIASTIIAANFAFATVFTEGITNLNFFATDLANNAEAARTLIVKLDKTPPSIAGSQTPAANSNGWNNTDVTVSFACSDVLSGLAPGSPPGTALVSSEGVNQQVPGVCLDLAGNAASAMLSLNIDKTPPNIAPSRTPAANANGWNNTNVTVSFACADALSGLALGNPPAATVLSSEGKNQQVSGTCLDLAGNSASATASGINIDKTPPALSGLPAVGCTLWPPDKKFVTVATISAADVLSGLASFNVTGMSNEPQEPNDPDIIISGTGLGPRTVQLRADRLGTGTGRIYTITSTATDAAGNVVNAISTCVVLHDQAL